MMSRSFLRPNVLGIALLLLGASCDTTDPISDEQYPFVAGPDDSRIEERRERLTQGLASDTMSSVFRFVSRDSILGNFSIEYWLNPTSHRPPDEEEAFLRWCFDFVDRNPGLFDGIQSDSLRLVESSPGNVSFAPLHAPFSETCGWTNEFGFYKNTVEFYYAHLGSMSAKYLLRVSDSLLPDFLIDQVPTTPEIGVSDIVEQLAGTEIHSHCLTPFYYRVEGDEISVREPVLWVDDKEGRLTLRIALPADIDVEWFSWTSFHDGISGEQLHLRENFTCKR